MFARLRAAALVATMVASHGTAHAQAATPFDCTKAMATAELNFCAEKSFDSADAKLNEAFKKVLSYVAETGGEKPYDAKSWEAALRASQHAWVAFRDADCKGLLPMSWSGGTATTGEVLGCMQEKTQARTKELLERYDIK
jgi:uncharacterized protein YecT (DUF1311 family)